MVCVLVSLAVDNMDAIREAGGIPLLVALLKRKEAAVLKNAAGAILNVTACEGTVTGHACKRLLLGSLFMIGVCST